MLINTLVLKEAKDSSSIENVFTTNDKLYKAFATPSTTTDPQTKEVLRYRHALWAAWQKLDEEGWSLELIEEIYRAIKDADDGVRDKLVYIGDRSTVIYTPPCCRNVLTKKLENWLQFTQEGTNEIDPLVKMALLHHQFEAIHPFLDGNGRTGRVLNVLYLSQAGLLDQPILYLSRFINDNKADYYRLLREVTEDGNWKKWLIYILSAVEDTAHYTLDQVNAIYDLFQRTQEKVKVEAPKVYSYELVEMLFHQPYCKISFLVEAGIASRNTASKYLNELDKIGILEKEQSGNEMLYLNKELYQLLAEN
jgi:Fic family protein